MSLSLMLALLVAQAAPAPAPTAGDAAIQAAAQAFGQCIGPKVQAAPATGTPEAAADAVWAMCGKEWGALETAVNAKLATLPAAQQAQGREQMRAGIAQGKTGIADGIRQMRAAQAGTPATPPAPAPSATPAPHAGH